MANDIVNRPGPTAMALGIAALLLFWIPDLGILVGGLALILGIVGIVVGWRNRSGVGMASAGTVLGGLSMSLAILWLVALSRELDPYFIIFGFP